MYALKLIATISVIFGVSSCAFYSSTNTKLNGSTLASKASYNVATDRGAAGNNKSLVILALSGGGSRAAYFSASTMFALQSVFSSVDILEEVDIISAVSGGSLPAAYYVISKDPQDETGTVESNRDWDRAVVADLMAKNYRWRWLGNWFWPTNIAKYWFTDFDRSDIMAQTFADNMFDSRLIGVDLTFGDVNPTRPNIVLNATNGTTHQFSSVFTFTSENFTDLIASDIDQYEIADAVMATASFPAVFNYMTLENFKEPDRYLHVFDGGNADNLGLESVEEIIRVNGHKYQRIVVILVDAFTESKGVDPKKSDGRQLLDYAVDLNFIDSSDSLLARNRIGTMESLESKLGKLDAKTQYIFYHIQFDDISNDGDRAKLNGIRTDFMLEDGQPKLLDSAVAKLIVQENTCLMDIKKILLDKTNSEPVKNRHCGWPKQHEHKD